MLLPSAPPAPAIAATPDQAPCASAGEGAALVNKRELAPLIGCSLPTLTAWIERYGDSFPVHRRGTNGVEWLFDAAGVVAFLREQRDAEQRDAEERAARLQQFALPGLDGTDDAPGVTKASDLLALAKVRQMQRREQMEAGLLVPTSDVRIAMTSAVARLARFLNSVLTQLARKHGWPDAQLRDAHSSATPANSRRRAPGNPHPCSARRFPMQPTLAPPDIVYAAASALIASAWQAAFNPPSRVDVAEYASQHRFLSNEGGGYVGRWSHDEAPYLVAPHLTLRSSLHLTTAIVGPGQCGKTEIAQNWLLHSIAADPADFPTSTHN